MQNFLTASSVVEVLDRLATFLSGSLIASLVSWLLNKRRNSAETVEIHARTVKVEAEARQVSTQTIIDAQRELVERAELISKLQDALMEANRERDNFEFDLRREKYERAQLETRHKLALNQVEQMNLTLKSNGLNYDDTKGKS